MAGRTLIHLRMAHVLCRSESLKRTTEANKENEDRRFPAAGSFLSPLPSTKNPEACPYAQTIGCLARTTVEWVTLLVGSGDQDHVSSLIAHRGEDVGATISNIESHLHWRRPSGKRNTQCRYGMPPGRQEAVVSAAISDYSNRVAVDPQADVYKFTEIRNSRDDQTRRTAFKVGGYDQRAMRTFVRGCCTTRRVGVKKQNGEYQKEPTEDMFIHWPILSLLRHQYTPRR
jgi:hypothetical protein